MSEDRTVLLYGFFISHIIKIMKRGLLLLLMIFSVCANGQSARGLINKSIERNSEIKNCSYTVYLSTKLNGMLETAFETGAVSLVKERKDTLLGMWLKIENYKGITDIYNGKDFIKIRRTDSSAYIWKAAEFSNIKHSMLADRLVFNPIVKSESFFKEVLSDSIGSLELQPDTFINPESCKLIRYTTIQQSKGQKPTRLTMEMYFRKTDLLMIGYTKKIEFASDNKLQKYEKVIIENILINQKIEPESFSLNLVPINFSMKQQTSQNIKNYIVIADAIADLSPDVFMKSKNYENIKDRNLLVVLINDTESVPCNNAMALLDSLYHEVKIDLLPLVISKSKITSNYDFLQNERNKFPDFLNAAELLSKSKIYTYPTFFLIDKHQKTIYKTEGYDIYLKAQLLNEIQKLKH